MLSRIFCSHCGNAEFLPTQPEQLSIRCSACNGFTAVPGNLGQAPEIRVCHEKTELQAAPDLLADILLTMKEKRLTLKQVESDLKNLEHQAAAIGEWLGNIEKQNNVVHSVRTALDLQYRLFDQLQLLKPGEVDLIDCDLGNNESLATCISRTFEAFGWTVNFQKENALPHCGEEITFIVGSGKISYPAAVVHLAICGAGFRLYNRADSQQTTSWPRLYIHRISTIPRFLPASKTRSSQIPPTEFRKSA